MVDINSIMTVTTLSVNYINAQILRQRLPEWIKEHDSTICCLQKTV